jgi:hypothetical protein
VIARANILLFFGASDSLRRRLCRQRLINADDQVRVRRGPVYALGVWFGASLFGRASEAVFRAILLRADRGRRPHRAACADGVLRAS